MPVSNDRPQVDLYGAFAIEAEEEIPLMEVAHGEGQIDQHAQYRKQRKNARASSPETAAGAIDQHQWQPEQREELEPDTERQQHGGGQIVAAAIEQQRR